MRAIEAKDKMNDRELDKECESIALEIFESRGGEMEIHEIHDAAMEYVDSHAWIIYPAFSQAIVLNCDTQQGDAFAKEAIENACLPDDPRQIISQINLWVAFGEMLARVSDFVECEIIKKEESAQ